VFPLDDVRVMQTLAQEVFRLRPDVVDLTMGELAYQGAMGSTDSTDESSYRIWKRGRRVVACAIFWPPGLLEWQVHPDHPEVLDEALDWFESVIDPTAELNVQARDGDHDAQRRVEERGFVFNETAPFMRLNMRSLDDIEEPRLPDGYRLRTMSEYDGDITQRVAVHQSAWAEFGTRVSMETYPVVMATWPYRSDLDFLVEDNTGQCVAFALGWYDEDNRVGEFEPVGTAPNARRLGLGRAVNLFGLQRFRDAGATRAIVACRGDSGHTAQCLLYESVGFSEISRQRRYVRGGSSATALASD